MSHLSNGIPILTAKNIQDGFIDFINVHYADQGEFDALTAKSKPNKDDVLITKDGTIGRCAVFNEDFPVCINQSVALIQPDHTCVSPAYLVGFVNTPSVQDILQGMGKGNALKHLQITELAELPVPHAPLSEQRRFAEVVETAKVVATQIARSGATIDSLFNSLVQRAFRGEL